MQRRMGVGVGLWMVDAGVAAPEKGGHTGMVVLVGVLAVVSHIVG
jgi:hypothetical protein